MNFLETKLFDETYTLEMVSLGDSHIINNYLTQIESGSLPLVRVFYLDDGALRVLDKDLFIAYGSLGFNKVPVDELSRDHLDIPTYLRR